ncbi:MAG: patatin-like phospholipase family protein [Myxococcota bacterium]
MREEPRKPTRAIVLSGGGARGAYEAGVLSFVLEDLAKRLDRPIRPDLVLGSSVGAIHACYVAGTAHLGRERARRLRQTWLQLRFDELFRISTLEALRVPLRVLSLLRVPANLRRRGLPEKLYGLLDTSRLERVVMSAIPWRSIRRNLVQGNVGALCLAATQIATGRVVLFVQGRDVERLRFVDDPSLVARGVSIGPAHALASAAIPALFPPVRVGDTYYADGGLRMNTPLAPAVHMGADRVLVVGLRSRVPTGREARAAERRVEGLGNPLFLYGKVLNAVLLDQLDTDLGQLRHINQILEAGEKAFGEDFLEEVNRSAGRQREGEGYRVIQDLVVRPSRDLGAVAAEVLSSKKRSGSLSRVARVLLSGTPFEADLLSYLFFDQDFTQTLLQLGYEDARQQEESLAAFFSDPP